MIEQWRQPVIEQWRRLANKQLYDKKKPLTWLTGFG